jgi:hypothetical protein
MLDPKKSGSQIESHILVQREQRLPWTICLNGLGPEEFMSTVLIDISEKGCQTPRVYKNKSLKFLIKGAMEQRLHVPRFPRKLGGQLPMSIFTCWLLASRAWLASIIIT